MIGNSMGNGTRMRNRLIKRVCSTASAAALLTSCGGGGGATPAPAPPSANRPPVFSSAATASPIENTAVSFYQAVASDPDGTAITYAISGGADAARFVIEGDRLRFAAPANFDLPGDSDEDNVYLVQISASDGTAATPLDLRITVTNDREGVALHRIATGFDQPVGLVAIPGDTRFFVPERNGRIYLFDPATGTKTLFFSLSVSTLGEGGLAAITPMADYASSGSFVVLFTSSNGFFLASVGRRSGTFGTPELTAGTIVSASLPAGASATGWLQRAPDGKIYIATSDAIGATDTSLGSLSATSVFGKLFVVEPNPDPFAGASPQYFIARRIAGGLRDPRGGTFFDGRLLLADRGADTRHELNAISVTAGGNFGWPYKEGTITVRAGAPTGVIDPALEYRYGTSAGAGTGIVGGVVYRGPIASLAGQYVFADRRGEVFATLASRLTGTTLVTASQIERRKADFAPDAGTLNQPAAVTEDAAGNVYIVDAGGDIFRVQGG